MFLEEIYTGIDQGNALLFFPKHKVHQRLIVIVWQVQHYIFKVFLKEYINFPAFAIT